MPSGADFIVPVLSVALVVYYSATTLNMAWEAKVTGVLIGAILVPLCLVHMVRLAVAISGAHGSFGFGELLANNLFNRQRFGLVALIVAFIATLEWVGTTGGLFLLLIGCMLVMGVRSVRVLLGVASVTAAVVYVLLIYLLNSRLPQGPVEKLIGFVLGR
jgi:hypothetical protein